MMHGRYGPLAAAGAGILAGLDCCRISGLDLYYHIQFISSIWIRAAKNVIHKLVKFVYALYHNPRKQKLKKRNQNFFFIDSWSFGKLSDI